MFVAVKDKNGTPLSCKALTSSGHYSIGRQGDCDITLPSGVVSAQHAEIVMEDGQGYILDKGSTNGTRRNGELLEKQKRYPLSCGDIVEVAASFNLEFVKDDPTLHDIQLSSPESSPLPVFRKQVIGLIHRLHEEILNKLKLSQGYDGEQEQRMEEALKSVLNEHLHELPKYHISFEEAHQALQDELTGVGPITPMLRSSDITEIMVNGPDHVFVERSGRLEETGVHFFSAQHLAVVVQRIVEPLGRHIDEASPMVDARLPDGSRVNVIIPPLALNGISMTIRKFSNKTLTTDDLVGFGTLTAEMASFLKEAVRVRKNIIVSGGTGSGKTTLLNILSLFIPECERIITIEDSAELKLSHANLVSLEARPANIEGKGRISIRDLVINSLRMRPDRIIVGECRGAEALDMLQAMNTGHDGSLTTCHANSPRDALSRLENMVMMAGFELPVSSIRRQISSAVNIIVQQSRQADGTRKVVSIAEITGYENDTIQMQEVFKFVQTGIRHDESGHLKVEGYHTATGNVPLFVAELKRNGVWGLKTDIFQPRKDH